MLLSGGGSAPIMWSLKNSTRAFNRQTEFIHLLKFCHTTAFDYTLAYVNRRWMYVRHTSVYVVLYAESKLCFRHVQNLSAYASVYDIRYYGYHTHDIHIIR